MKAAQLLSRKQAQESGQIALDVAPDQIIQANNAAHDLVRLYFRPRTPTQWNIEGIREPCDFYLGKHAPTLFMLTFDATMILAMPDVRFSDGNMQGMPHIFSNDAGFNQLNFEDIYHEGLIPEDDRDRIRRSRCAEVLVQSPLALPPALRAVICRSSAERQMLLHELGEDFPARDRVRVFNEAGVFNADFAFVETVDLARDGVHVKFHSPRRGSATGEVRVKVTPQQVGANSLHWHNPALEFWKTWNFTADLPEGNYLVEIWIRNCLAYRSLAILADEPF